MAKKIVNAGYTVNPKWEVSYEYQHGKDLIEVGDKVKIKFQRGEFKFYRHVYHSEKNVSWIDCTSLHGYHSFYVEEINKKIKPKKFRKKRNVQ